MAFAVSDSSAAIVARHQSGTKRDNGGRICRANPIARASADCMLSPAATGVMIRTKAESVRRERIESVIP